MVEKHLTSSWSMVRLYLPAFDCCLCLIYLYVTAVHASCKDESAGMEHLLPWSDFIKEHCICLTDVENVTVEKHSKLRV